jgi:Leucine-rich repeat (LRR) protein
LFDFDAHPMGNCCGKEASQTQQVNNLRRQLTKRVENWKRTGVVSIRDGNLKEVPDSVASVGSAARVLDASNNRIQHFPEFLGQLSNLQRIVFSNNLVTSFSIGPLPELRVRGSVHALDID